MMCATGCRETWSRTNMHVNMTMEPDCKTRDLCVCVCVCVCACVEDLFVLSIKYLGVGYVLLINAVCCAVLWLCWSFAVWLCISALSVFSREDFYFFGAVKLTVSTLICHHSHHYYK